MLGLYFLATVFILGITVGVIVQLSPWKPKVTLRTNRFNNQQLYIQAAGYVFRRIRKIAKSDF